MKTKYLSSLAVLALAFGSSSCISDQMPVESIDEGMLNTSSIVPEVLNAEIIISEQNASRGAMSRDAYDLSDFRITVEDSRGVPAAEWTYAAMPSLPTFPVGTYTINVVSRDEVHAEWDAPRFVGSQTFVIRKNEVTNVETVVCKLSNICVSVQFDEALLNAAGEDLVVTVTSCDDAHSLSFTRETMNNKGYFHSEGQTTLAVRFYGTVNGTLEDFPYTLQNVEAGQHRKVSFSLRGNTNPVPDEFGDVIPDGEGISVSTTVTREDLTSDSPIEEEILPSDDRPGKEDNPDAPDTPDEPVGDATVEFSKPDNCPLDIDGGVNEVDGYVGDAIVIIRSESGFKKLEVVIDSEGLTPDVLKGVGLASSFDLVTGLSIPDGDDLSEGLAGLGLPVKEQITEDPDNAINFDITQFVPLLGIYPGNSDFTITVTPIQGEPKSMTLKFHK
ncbi:MAG: DUF4493 domain-containing protein [Bacteroidales bacterium]|nr:DUF4493 domain-containing protein [Bacteroidales bacterium]